MLLCIILKCHIAPVYSPRLAYVGKEPGKGSTWHFDPLWNNLLEVLLHYQAVSNRKCCLHLDVVEIATTFAAFCLHHQKRVQQITSSVVWVAARLQYVS